jgi:hypothetical protein
MRQARLAVLIDGENVTGNVADPLFAKIAEHGVAKLRRVYGDFSNPCLKTWIAPIARHAIVAQQVFKNGKNATDVTMIMDAMELLLSERFDGFCIVSSDADFTRLSERIREKVWMSMGSATQTRPPPFAKAAPFFTVRTN